MTKKELIEYRANRDKAFAILPSEESPELFTWASYDDEDEMLLDIKTSRLTGVVFCAGDGWEIGSRD